MTEKQEHILRQKLETVFDGLYQEAEDILKQFNPCEARVKNGCFSCIGQTSKLGGNNTAQCCCIGCSKWTDKGCVADKPLTCRTWLCNLAGARHEEADNALFRLSSKVSNLGFYVTRGDKQASLDKAISIIKDDEDDSFTFLHDWAKNILTLDS